MKGAMKLVAALSFARMLSTCEAYSPRFVPLRRNHAASRTRPVMSAARLAQLGALSVGLSSSGAAMAAEPRSTPWAYSTFLEAIETE